MTKCDKCDSAVREDKCSNCGGMLCHVTGCSEYGGGLRDECHGDFESRKP